jgi:hypothetical protein
MSKLKSNGKEPLIRREGKNRWSLFVAETEEKVKEAKRRVVELELALETFQRNEREGMPWPLQGKATQNQSSTQFLAVSPIRSSKSESYTVRLQLRTKSTVQEFVHHVHSAVDRLALGQESRNSGQVVPGGH